MSQASNTCDRSPLHVVPFTNSTRLRGFLPPSSSASAVLDCGQLRRQHRHGVRTGGVQRSPVWPRSPSLSSSSPFISVKKSRDTEPMHKHEHYITIRHDTRQRRKNAGALRTASNAAEETGGGGIENNNAVHEHLLPYRLRMRWRVASPINAFHRCRGSSCRERKSARPGFSYVTLRPPTRTLLCVNFRARMFSDFSTSCAFTMRRMLVCDEGGVN